MRESKNMYPSGPVVRRIKELPMRQQPREIMERLGAENCTDDILLSIVLRYGTSGVNVLDLARSLLDRYGSLAELSRASVHDLQCVRGIGRVKAQVVKAAFALAINLQEEINESLKTVRTPEDVTSILAAHAAARDTEAFWVLPLDTKNRLKSRPVRVSEGILDASLVHPREVFKEAIRMSCAAVILAHNHPSGDPHPSGEDLKVTRKLIEAGNIVDIAVLDHIILGQQTEHRSGYMSLRESGLVRFDPEKKKS